MKCSSQCAGKAGHIVDNGMCPLHFYCGDFGKKKFERKKILSKAYCGGDKCVTSIASFSDACRIMGVTLNFISGDFPK